MATRSRPRRGGGGGGGEGGYRSRGPPRGGPRRPYRRPPPSREFKEIESLGKEEVECEAKTIVIEFNSNEQGQFMKISEANNRSRIIMNMDSADTLRSRLNDFIKDLDTIKDAVVEGEAERLATGEPFSQGRRKYYVDVRENSRGKFVKLTMLSGSKSYVAFPLENLQDFYSKFNSLYDEHYNPSDNKSPPPPASPTNNNLPSSREVRAGGKSFYFDVDKNDRGVFVRLTEVVRNYGRRTHINIPNSCWPQMSEVFSQLSQELPYEEGSAVNSASEDN